MPNRNIQRCAWAKTDLSIAYHDEQWGVPTHDDCVLFEFLILEGAQAGLSWETILKKRENYRAAFAQFDPTVVARFGKRDIARLLKDAGIVRNRVIGQQCETVPCRAGRVWLIRRVPVALRRWKAHYQSPQDAPRHPRHDG